MCLYSVFRRPRTQASQIRSTTSRQQQTERSDKNRFNNNWKINQKMREKNWKRNIERASRAMCHRRPTGAVVSIAIKLAHVWSQVSFDVCTLCRHTHHAFEIIVSTRNNWLRSKKNSSQLHSCWRRRRNNVSWNLILFFVLSNVWSARLFDFYVIT